MENALIEFRDVTKRFGTRTILHGVNLEIYEGQVTTLIGKSGTGKSVLLKHIIGLLAPDSGRILFRGKPIDELKKREWNAYLSQISYMFQNNALFDSLTVFENIALPLRQTTKLSRRIIERKVMARVEQVELTEVAHKYPSEISGGMQKRTAMARALVTDPQIVLFDEPTTGQDPIRKNAILSMVAEYQREFGFTAIMISHEIPDVFYISNRIIALYDGKIIFQGPPDAFDRFEHPFRDEFVRSLEILQEELSGLYSRRQFKVRYQTDLARKNTDGTYAAAVFTLEDLDTIIANLGHDTAQGMIRSLGTFINKHFGAVGGFSARQRINEFGTVLPFSDVMEAERILADFKTDLHKHGLCDIYTQARDGSDGEDCFEFAILAGLARGKPHIELDSVMEFARFKQKEIARFECKTRR